jgi:hypothetical protein
MADNETTGTGKAVATDKVTYSGDADQNVQLVKVVQTTGAEGSKTVVDPAHDDPDGGNPAKIGGHARTSTPTSVAADDRVDAWFDEHGALQIRLRDGSGNDPLFGNWGTDSYVSGNVTGVATSSQMYGYDGSNSIRIHTKTSSSSVTSVSGSASSVSLLASTSGRVGAMVYNDSTATLYVKFGATASTTSFTYLLAAGATLEFPQPIYTGAVDGIWASATGAARITELT